VFIEDESQDVLLATVLKFVFIKELSSTAKIVEDHKYVFTKNWNLSAYNVVEIVFVCTHVLGQDAESVMEEASAYTKEYELDARTVMVLKYVHINEEEWHVKSAKVNAKPLIVLCCRQENTKDIVFLVLFFYKNSTFMFIKWKILKGVENRYILGPSTVKKWFYFVFITYNYENRY